MSGASRASRAALRAPRAGRSGVKGGLLRLPPSHLLSAPPADPCRRPATLAPSRKLCPLLRTGTFPWNLYNSRRGRALRTRRGSSVYLRRPFSPPRTTTRSSERRPCPLLDAGFPSGSGKPGKHPDLFVFYLFSYRFMDAMSPIPELGCLFSQPCTVDT